MDASFLIMQYATAFYLPALFLVLFFPYVFTYWRNDREGIKDEQVGLKVIFCFFLFFGYQMLLGLGAFLLASLLSGEFERVISRSGPIVLVCIIIGVTVFTGHKLLLSKTNQTLFPRIPRFYHGLSVFVATTACIASLLVMGFMATDGALDALGAPLGLLIVYGIAWAYLIGSLFRARDLVSLEGQEAEPKSDQTTIVDE